MDAHIETRPYHTIGRFGSGNVSPVRLTPRDLDYLHVLFTHGLLSSEALRTLAAPAVSQRAITRRLFALKHPPNEYIVQPEAQERFRNAYCNHIAFKLSDRGAQSLVDAGRLTIEDYDLWAKLRQNFKHRHFEHDRAAGHVLASFELGAREAGIRFISWRDILNRPKCPAPTRDARNPLAIPYEVSGERHVLIPDGLFGLQYPKGACFFSLEIDMGTEQQKDADSKNVTLRQKLRAYRTIIRDKLFASRFGLPSLLLLMITPGVIRMRNIMEHARTICDHEDDVTAGSFLFKALPTLGRPNTPLPIDAEILSQPWNRPQHSAISLTNL